MAVYSLWVEGYACTGESGPAHFLGSFDAISFNAAVEKWNETNNKHKEWGDLTYHNGNWYAWGCRIFDNEADARASFG